MGFDCVLDCIVSCVSSSSFSPVSDSGKKRPFLLDRYQLKLCSSLFGQGFFL